MRLIVAGAVLGGCLLVLVGHNWVPAQESNPPAASSNDDEKLRQAAERFLAVLEKNPRRGTALDRLYGYHVEAGTLDTLVARFEERTAKDPSDGAAWMILGMIASQRGHDAAAVEAFTQAEKVRTDDALASYYLGQALVLVGRSDDAAAAFERAIAKKPARADLLEMFQSLGRVYQRGQKGEQALEVWGRLERLFPDDLRVQEQIAATLVEEGEYAQALPRFEGLSRKVKDDYRAATFRVEAADIKVRLGQPQAALADFEELLGRLNPDNWLYRDIRRRIDEVFLKTDDQAGLAAYYEKWIRNNPDDLAAMTRLARILAGIGRAGEAQQWLDKALKLAPSRNDLRLALIEQYVGERQYQQAIAQYELLARNDPNNPDVLREWGRLILKDNSRPEAERRGAAAAVWRRLLDARPKDSLTATQIADLFRHSEMPDEALALYKKAIDLSPEAPQYREYLGEFLHTLKRSDEALAAWREIAAGKNHTPPNVARLAEVLAGFGYVDEAIANILEACRLDAGEFKYPYKAAELLARGEKYDDALAQLAAADKLADGPESRENVLRQRIRVLQLAEGLDHEIESLQKELARSQNITKQEPGAAALAERWHLLSRYLEAGRRFAEADRAIGKALAIDETSIAYRAAAARIEEFAGDLQGAADACRALAGIDRRNRTEHLMNVARLESQLGRIEQALAAGRDLLAAAPGNPDTYEFFAQLCFQLGRTDEGLDALRRSVRLNPAEPKQMLTLAAALADQFRTDEAVELYWRAFDTSKELDARLAVVQKLADLYLQRNQLDRLIERLDHLRREAAAQREMTICLAQAHQSAGDYGTARQELERLLEQNPRDTQLLQQLANLAETAGELALAVKYQQQLVAITPGKETQSRLAQLLVRTGASDEATAILERLAADEQDPGRLLTALDSLLAHDKRDAVLKITERALRDQPQNWELLYRAGETLARDNPAEAVKRFRSILALGLPDDDTGEKSSSRGTAAQSQPAAAPARSTSRTVAIPLLTRMSSARQIRAAVGIDAGLRSLVMSGPWSPADFGQARMAALAWLLNLSEKAGTKDQLVQEFREPLNKPAPRARELWDWLYLQQIRNETSDVRDVAKRLSQTGDPIGQWLYLTYLPVRGMAGGPPAGNILAGAGLPEQAGTQAVQPLPTEELDHILACYRGLWKNRSELAAEQGSAFIGNVIHELELAGRNDEAAAIFNSIIDAAARPQARRLALQLAAARGDCDAALKVFDLFAADQLAGAGRSQTAAAESAQAAAALAELMAQRAVEHDYGDVLRIVKRYLVFAQHRHETSMPGGRDAKRQAPARGVSALARLRSGLNLRIWIGKTVQASRFDYPDAPNDFYDAGAINVLREAFELYRHDDLVSDLIAHFTAQADTAPEAERLWWRLGLAYLRWWSDDQDDAIFEFSRAVELAPNDAGLKFELAALHERRQDYPAALAVIDDITPLDHAMVQERETALLRLTLRSGLTERARLAAERLFGLRLDSRMQLQLAQEMRGLGMNDQADTILARARRGAGNRVETLVSLMHQYQADKKSDLAVQVAHEILRRGGSTTTSSRSARVVNQQGFATATGTVDTARRQALSVLSRSGQLDELISRVEAQLAASPASVQLLQTLNEYYEVAGRQPKILETLERMVAARPDDARLRFQVAQQLAQAGRVDESIGHYLAALKKEPALIGQNYQNLQQVFRRANRTGELAALLDDIDLATIGNPSAVMNMILTTMSNQRARPAGTTTGNAPTDDNAAGLKLFRRAWNAYPTYRPTLVRYLQRNDLVNLPEVFEYTREIVFSEAALSAGDPWGVGQQIIGTTLNGNTAVIMTNTTQLIDMAQRRQSLPALQKDLEQNLEKHPTWLGGKALLAMIAARSDDPPRAKQIAEELMADRQHPIPFYTAWMLGQELDRYQQMQPLVQALYEAACNQPIGSVNPNLSGPVRRLVEIYKQTGDREKARSLVHRSIRDTSNAGLGNQYPAGYPAYLKLNQAPQISQQLVALGFPLDAVRYLNEILEDESLPETARQFGGNNLEPQLRQLEQLLANARNSITSEKNLAETLEALLEPRPDPVRKAGQPAVGLMLQIQPRETRQARMTSLVEEVLRSAAKGEHQQAARDRVAALLEKYPQDVSVEIVAALCALAEGRSEAVAAALAQLDSLVQQSPLEELAEGARANSRQRAEAARWLGLWLVAREGLKVPEQCEVAVRLAKRALAAAKRQSDRKFALAIFREWGLIAHEAHDMQTVETLWSEMAAFVLPTATKAKAGSRALTVPTAIQFNQAADTAQLASDVGLTELSLRIVRDALKAGPPVDVAPDGGGFGMPGPGMVTRTQATIARNGSRTAQNEPSSTYIAAVEARLLGLVQVWNRNEVPLTDQYETLAAIAFPEARPLEIFIYPLRTGGDPGGIPRIGKLLVTTAVKAGRGDDLALRIAAREKHPLAEPVAKVLKSLLEAELGTK